MSRMLIRCVLLRPAPSRAMRACVQMPALLQGGKPVASGTRTETPRGEDCCLTSPRYVMLLVLQPL